MTKTSPDPSRTQLRNLSLFLELPDKGEPERGPIAIPIDQIVTSTQLPESPANQFQARRYFDEDAMKQLIESIRDNGILQPLLVRLVGDLASDAEPKRYELIAGERRYRAALAIGLTEVPVVIRQLSDEQALTVALTENLQRQDLNPLEETQGILQLLSLKLGRNTEDVIRLLNQLASVNRGVTDNIVRKEEQQLIEGIFLGIGRFTAESFRTHRLPLLNLPDDVLQVLARGELEYTKAKAIAQLKNSEQRGRFLEEAIAQKMSLSQIKERIAQYKQEQSQQQPSKKPSLSERTKLTFTRLQKAKLWNDPTKKKKLERLLGGLEKLLEEAEPTDNDKHD